MPCAKHGRFPHSEIDGSQVCITSPSLIADLHVLHRLSVLRYPPYALIVTLSIKTFLYSKKWTRKIVDIYIQLSKNYP